MLFYEKLVSDVYAKGIMDIVEVRPFSLPEIFDNFLQRDYGLNKDQTNNFREEMLESPLPFRVCSFEVNGSFGISDQYTDKFGNVKKVLLMSLAAVEKSPTEIDIYASIKIGDKFFTIFPDETESYLLLRKQFETIIKGICWVLKDHKIAIEHTRQRLKVGSGKNKGHLTIRNIVHVYPKTERPENIAPVAGGRMDFSHRFEVRGHWRKCEYIGKDREGNYRIPGATWVVPCVKGPENLPLIKKTRVLDKSFNQELRA